MFKAFVRSFGLKGVFMFSLDHLFTLDFFCSLESPCSSIPSFSKCIDCEYCCFFSSNQKNFDSDDK